MIINNRELSWLVFNDRVLQEAQDPSVPLLQRLRFLGIFSNNQDEFIKVRVANLMRLIDQSKTAPPVMLSGGYTPAQLMPLVSDKIEHTQVIFTRVYHELLSEMERENIFVINEKQLSERQIQFCRDYFSDVISQRMVPLILRKSTEMPFLQDGVIYLAVQMTRHTAGRDLVRYAIIRIPTSSASPRFVVLPSESGRHEIIFIDDIIRLCLDEVFFMFNYDDISAYTFKFLRDALLTIDDDVSKSLVEKMEEGIDNRLHGRPVRLIYDRTMPPGLLDLISRKMGITNSRYIDAGGRYHLLKDLMKFPMVRPDLENQNPKPILHKFINPFASILKVVRTRDILLCYPYHTFNHVIDFLREAAIDPKVEKISITLYRTAERSKIVNALLNAAKNGKKVVALVELMARFDEEQNVENTDVLQRAGVKVIHSVTGLKVHSKLILVERREGTNRRGYAYVGTGNFNESTAKIYCDFGLLTVNPNITDEVAQVFDFLQNTHKHYDYKHLLVSPYNMRDHIAKLIDREIANAKAGKRAYIYAKFNSVTDQTIIRKLYAASQSGVQVKLIVRSACCLAPAIEGQSQNIKAISIVDKFLEHARLIICCNSSHESTYILSADCMPRNFERRVEIGVPILDAQLRKLLRKYFDLQWSDNVKARDLGDFGQNNYIPRAENEKPIRSQIELYHMLNT